MPKIESKLQRALRLVVTEESERADAAKQIKELAERYPDLFERCARQFIDCIDEEDADAAKAVGAVIRLLPGNDKMSTTDAILRWLDEYKEGTPSEIVRALSQRIETGSEQPESIIYSTLGSLKKRGKVVVVRNSSKERVFRRSKQES